MSERKNCSFISKVRNIIEIICNGKGVRKIVALISGAVVALFSTAYMLIIDTIVNSQVYFLFGLAVFGLAAGILQVIGSNNCVEEEDKFSWFALTISAFMGVGLILSIGAITSDTTYINFLASTENADSDKALIKILEISTIIFAYVNTIVAFFAATLTTREHFVHLNKRGSSKTKSIINITKKSLSGLACLIMIVAFVILFLSPLINGAASLTYKDGLYRFQETTSYSVSGFNAFFGGNCDLKVVSEIIERTNKLEPQTTIETLSIVAKTSILSIISFVLIALGNIASLVLVLFKKTEKHMYIRILTGLVALAGGLLSLSLGNELINLLTAHVVEGTTFTIGAGVTAFSIITIVAGVIFTVVPLIEVDKKAERTLD